MRFRRRARDAIAELYADPEYAASMAELDRQAAIREAEGRRMEAPILEDLAALGIEVSSVYDLLDSDAPAYDHAVPLLVDHLSRDYDIPTLEGIARALSTTAAAGAYDVLEARYRQERERPENDYSERLNQGLAVALAGAVTPDHAAKYLLLFDDENDDNRVLLLLGLKRLRTQAAIQKLRDLRGHAVLGPEARRLVRRRRSRET